MNNYVIESNSKYKPSGFFFKINTKQNTLYNIKYKIKLVKGDKCFINCEDDNQKRYIDCNKYMFKLDEKKSGLIQISGIGKLLNIGILFTGTNKYKLKVYDFEIKENSNLVNNYNNLVLLKGTNIKTKNKLVPPKEDGKNLINNQNEFHKRGIYQVYISLSLKHFDRIKKIYSLKDYHNKKDPLLIYGMYDLNDFEIAKQHEGLKYIIWGGSDIDDRIKASKIIVEKIKNLKNVKHISISKNLEERINKAGLKHERIKFNLADPQIFKPIHNPNANSIYIYNGYTEGKEWIYGKEIYEEVMKRLPEFKYILSNKIKVPHEEMPKLYSECFIGLRLTKNDGNANTAQELELMNIPLIHNGECSNCIKWNNVDDVELEIRYRNIKLFNESIQEYKKILFVSNDYPSYGGAATNTLKLIEWYSQNGHNTYGIFTFFEEKKEMIWNNTSNNIAIGRNSESIKKCINKCTEYFGSDPDLIIFRSYTYFEYFKNIKCPKFFLVPGLFMNELDKPFDNIRLDELDKYVNKYTIELCKNVDKVYVASKHTIDFLKKYYNIHSYPLYFNYIPYFEKKIVPDENFNKRKFEYGIIQSNFDRKIKNVDNIINKLSSFKDKVVLIGHNSKKYSQHGFKCENLMEHKNVIKYMKNIKYIIQNSFYESLSNVIVEARFNGCKIIDPNNSNIFFLNKVPNITTNMPNNIPIKKNAKILISSTQYPGYGGAATNAYKLIIYLRKKGYKCAGLFIHNQNVNCDPEKIGNIYFYQYADYKFNNVRKNEQFRKSIIKTLGGEPDICFGKNYVAPYLNKILFNKSPNVYLVSGISYEINNENSVDQYIRKINNGEKFNFTELEIRTINNCDYIVCNSPLLLNTFCQIYNRYNEKIYKRIMDTTKYDVNQNEIKQKFNKEYDIILVCSSFIRKEKNFQLVANMLKDPQFDKYKKCIVGDNNHIFKDIMNLTVYNLQSNVETKKLIIKSKLMIIPSLFEANSNSMREALNNDCLVLLNKNVGWHECFPETFVCNSYDVGEWKSKTLNILQNYEFYQNFKAQINTDIEIDEFIYQYSK